MANADHWIYFKVANEFEIALGHSILSPVQAIDKNTKFVWTNALIAGAILVLFIYNALIASATASRLYVAYSLFLLASLVTFLVYSRLTEQWGWLIDRHSTGYTALAFFAFSFWFMDELFKDKLTSLSRLCSWLGTFIALAYGTSCATRTTIHDPDNGGRHRTHYFCFTRSSKIEKALSIGWIN